MSKRIAETISIVELLDMFPTEEKAVEWLEDLRWGGEPICPHCGCFERISVAKSKKFTYWCGDCRKHFTVKVGMVMESSKIPLRKWAVAIYYILTARKGISSLQLSKEIGITQKSAWFMLHRIREACKQGDLKLSEHVEVDETYLGGREKNKKHGKKTKPGGGAGGKTAIIGMRERKGRVKAMVIEDGKGHTLKKAVRDNVNPGSLPYTPMKIVDMFTLAISMVVNTSMSA